MSDLINLSAIASDAQIELWLAVGLDAAADVLPPVPQTIVSLKVALSAAFAGLSGFVIAARPLSEHAIAPPRPIRAAPPPDVPGLSGRRRLAAAATWLRDLPASLLTSAGTQHQLSEAMARIDLLSRERERLLRQCSLLAETIRLAEDDRAVLENRLAAVRIEERQRIALDLHDQAGQEMGAAIAALRLLRDRARGPNRRRLDEIAGRLCEVGHRLHHAVVGDCPRIVEDLGLRRALDETIAAYAADGGLRRSFVVTGLRESRLSPLVEATLYRVAQEAMTNVVKHARASRMKVRLIMTGGSISLIVSDDGTGFCAATRTEDDFGSVGLGGMSRRVAAIGGALEIASAPGAGTTVTAAVPLGPAPTKAPAT